MINGKRTKVGRVKGHTAGVTETDVGDALAARYKL
jgi:hypothetical protein